MRTDVSSASETFSALDLIAQKYYVDTNITTNILSMLFQYKRLYIIKICFSHYIPKYEIKFIVICFIVNNITICL